MSREPRPSAGQWPPVPGPLVTGRFCAQDESARNAGGTPGCGTADGAARRTRGTQTGSPPVPAGRGCRHPACGAPAQREASAALAMPVRTRNAGTRVRTLRTGSLAPRPALCHAAAARAADCPMRSYVHGKTAEDPHEPVVERLARGRRAMRKVRHCCPDPGRPFFFRTDRGVVNLNHVHRPARPTAAARPLPPDRCRPTAPPGTHPGAARGGLRSAAGVSSGAPGEPPGAG